MSADAKAIFLTLWSGVLSSIVFGVAIRHIDGAGVVLLFLCMFGGAMLAVGAGWYLRQAQVVKVLGAHRDKR